MKLIRKCVQKLQAYAFHTTSLRPAADDVSKSTDLKKVLASKIPPEQEKIKKFRKDHGKFVMGQVTIAQMYGGMRGVPGLVCETSLLDPHEGIRFRGYSIPECQQCLPAAKGGCEPLPEGIFWLLLTGDIPTEEQTTALSKEWAERSCLPEHVHVLLDNLPKNVHPMAQFSAAITALSSESLFFRAYHCGVRKTDYWDSTYEDSMNLLAKLPVIAAKVYKNTYKGGSKDLHVDTNVDWSHNFAYMLGYQKPQFIELLRLYLTLHSDHEGGNVSAHTTHLVGSALSDPYLCLAAGLNGLAGPLHGLANQETLIWLESLHKAVGDKYDEKAVKDFVVATLKSGQVVPGYGHAVLRKTDPRYTAQREFAMKHLPDDPLFKLVAAVFNVVPPILQGLGKVANPWPNVDAHSGILLQHFGMVEANYYTVLFGVSRAMGVLSSLVWDRALLFPIERPKSFTTDYLIKFVKDGGKKK